jgi:hypothetical protein
MAAPDIEVGVGDRLATLKVSKAKREFPQQMMPSKRQPRMLRCLIHALCCALVLPCRKSAFRAGFWPDCYRESNRNRPCRPKAGRRADFGSFLAAVRPNSGPEGRFSMESGVPPYHDMTTTWRTLAWSLESSHTTTWRRHGLLAPPASSSSYDSLAGSWSSPNPIKSGPWLSPNPINS